MQNIASINLSGRQQGGQVSGPVMVGERGPELFVPNGSGRVINNNQLRNGGGDGDITIIKQTTGRIDNVEKQYTSRGDVLLIIQEQVPQIMAEQQSDTNSQFSKAQVAQTSANRRLT